MKNKKGFTLVELLAVIVVLGIILVIAVPNILNIINKAKIDAYERQKELVITAARNYVINNGNQITWNNDTAEVYLKDLQDANLIDDPLKDPRGGNFNNSKPAGTKVILTKDTNENISYDIYVPSPITDTIPPVITLVGNNSVDIYKGDTYTDAGATATDDVDGDITSNIVTNNTVDPLTVGTYTITYNVTDNAGNNATAVTRTVNVLPTITAFVSSFGGTSNEFYDQIIYINDGYIVVGNGTSSNGDLTGLSKGAADAILVKYNLNGTVAWKKNYGGSSNDNYYGITNATDGYVAVGSSASSNGDLVGLNKGLTDAIIVKYDTSGNVVWKKNFGGNSSDIFLKIVTVSDGYIVIGNSNSNDADMFGINHGASDAIIVKYDTNGNVVWKKSFGGGGNDYYHGVTEISNGYIAIGYGDSSNGDFTGLNKGLRDGIIVKYDTSGNVVWKKSYGGTRDDWFYSVYNNTDSYIVVGLSDSTDGDLTSLNKGSYDAIVVKYNTSGNIIWKKNYGGTGIDYNYSVTSAKDGYLVSGNSNSTNGDLTGLNKGSNDATLIKYDTNGNVVWKKNYGGSSDDYFNWSINTLNGYVAIGYSYSNNGALAGLNKGGIDGIIFAIDPTTP